MKVLMVKEEETEIKQPPDQKAQYITVPRYVVMDSQYPFKKDIPVQQAMISIDPETKSLIIKPIIKKPE